MSKKYYCIEKGCNNEICKATAMKGKGRCRSCAGKIHSKRMKGEGNSNHKGGRTLKKYYCIELDCHNEISYPNWLYGNKRCQSCAVKYLHKLGILNTKGKNNGMTGKHHDESTRRKMNISHGGDGRFKHERLPHCQECGKELGDCRSERCNSCKVKEQHRNNVFNYKKTPNKPEKLLRKLLNEFLPSEYKFVGNNKIVIDTFNPDFVNCNGQKKIIELFGCYWHKCSQCGFGNERTLDKKRLGVYKKFGYKTLIVWEHELKNLDKVKDKILKFNKSNYDSLKHV